MIRKTVKKHKILLSTGSINYLETGHGRPIVLLHGAPMTSLGFIRVISGLSENYRVIAPDFPGFGKSIPGGLFAGKLADYSEFVVEFCSALELTDAVVFVNDSSGSIGLNALASIPNRVAGIVVADTVPIPMSRAAWIVKMILRYIVTSRVIRLINRRYNALPWIVASVAPGFRPFSRAHRRLMVSEFDTREKRERVLDVFSEMATDSSFMLETERKIKLVLANKPVLLLFGQLDPMRFVGGIGRFKKLFRFNDVRIIPFEEHFPILGSGKRVAREIDNWIRRRL